MVAEAIPEQEEAQAAAVTPEALESIPEPTTETPEAEETDYGSLLESLDVSESATDEATGTAPTGDSPSNPLEGLTPEQIEERGAQRERERIQRESETTQRQARIDGLNRALPATKESVKQMLSNIGVDTDVVLAVLGKMDELHGTHIALRESDFERVAPQVKAQAYQEAEASVSKHLLDAVAEDLGDNAQKAIQGEIGKSIKTWPDMAKAIAAEARKGYVAKEEVTKAQKRVLEKIDTALKGRGMSLKDITGNGGSDLPPIRGGGNVRPGTAAWAQSASINDINEALKKAGV